MLFVLEQFIENRREKRRIWQEDGLAWVKKQNGGSAYGYYSLHDYEKKHPLPGAAFRAFLATSLPILVVGLCSGLLALAIINAPKSEPDPNNPNNCSWVAKKEDKVAVVYGDFVGSEGVITGVDEKGCGVNVRLTKSTNTRDDCANAGYRDCRREKNVGEELYVDTVSNVTKI